MTDVLVYRTGKSEPERFTDAYLQADDSTVLIRQKMPDQPSAWTTTAVFLPGSYTVARYDETPPQPA